VFLQANTPTGIVGPVKIEGMKGAIIGRRLAQLAADNAFELVIIGLIASDTPVEHAQTIASQFVSAHTRDGWFQPTKDLLMYVQHVASLPLQELIAQVHPAAISEHIVDIDTIAAMLGVSVPTVRRMVDAEKIPCFRLGRLLRFVPADVIARLQHGH
jgi:excisionase family DNA binding protein